MKCRSFIVVLVGALAGCAALFAAGCAEEQGGLEDYIAALGRENQLLEERNAELKTEHDWLEGRCEEWRQEIDALTEGKTYNEEQIAEIEDFIAEKLALFNCKLDTIVGVGTTLAASFFAEIGDITRFDSPDKLAAFAGIDPSVKQSGEFNGTRNKMSKRGSPYLRRTFWLAAVSGIRTNPALKAIYDKKRAQGKHHAVAVSAVMHKLCNIVFAILKTNEPYKIVLPE